MKILFLGNFRVDYTSETHYKKTFEKLGHQVITLQESDPLPDEPLENINMLFWVHTHGWKTPGIEHLLTTCDKLNIPIVGYHLDLWKGLKREKDLELDEYWKWLDYFFTCDKLFIPDLEKMGIKSFFLPAGVFEEECYPGTPINGFWKDIIFVGTKNYHPEWKYRGELIDWLKETYEDRFEHYGRDGVNQDQIRGKDLNDLYASAKVVIGDTLCKGFDYPYYFSDRVFETTGRGGFIIHPYIKGLGDFFVLNGSKKELVTYPFGDFDYLKYTIDYYLEHNKEREQIRLRGHQRTIKDHTYTNRLQYILNTIKNEGTNAK